MFRTLIYPSSGACDYSVELPHWLYCSWFDVCWSFGVAGLGWYLCCRLHDGSSKNSFSAARSLQDQIFSCDIHSPYGVSCIVHYFLQANVCEIWKRKLSSTFSASHYLLVIPPCYKTGLFKMIVGGLTTVTSFSRCNPMWFISMGLRQGSGLCSSSSRKYPGTEGMNQNRHWNNHRWHATNSLERTRLSRWCL